MDIILLLIIVILVILFAILVLAIYIRRGWAYPKETEVRDGVTGSIYDTNIRRVHLRVVYLERRVTELETEIRELKEKLGKS